MQVLFSYPSDKRHLTVMSELTIFDRSPGSEKSEGKGKKNVGSNASNRLRTDWFADLALSSSPNALSPWHLPDRFPILLRKCNMLCNHLNRLASDAGEKNEMVFFCFCSTFCDETFNKYCNFERWNGVAFYLFFIFNYRYWFWKFASV